MNDWLSHTRAGDLANQVAVQLKSLQQRIVLAESCTGGLVTAMLASVPGISECLCGSWVTYRLQSKREWLNVPSGLIDRDSGVSQATSDAMALAALAQTSEADWAAAITGHLGPNAPPPRDGRVFVAIAKRTPSACELAYGMEFHLSPATRQLRQWSAAEKLLQTLVEQLA